ncbi:hypothetical protein GCM10009530_34290 [Microbispora corallina]|uniref:Gas vesicle protein n=1 Tax=Microbispora corallina TaxID=83302 RepID=A0ABQ4G1Q2_9ACTN|nr:gas vesicle protein GvpO [Microbispora corallina]GIH40996.1 hypothetical protein Mco01_39960 [Microbispora corallina]
MPPRRRDRPDEGDDRYYEEEYDEERYAGDDGDEGAPVQGRPVAGRRPRRDSVVVQAEPQRPRRRPLTATSAGRAGLRHIADLTAREPEAVTLVQPVENGWVVDVEVVEDHRIPSSSDIIALYEAQMDEEGNLLSYRRTRRYRRGAGDLGGGYGR